MNRSLAYASALLAALLATCTVPVSAAPPIVDTVSTTVRIDPDGSVTVLSSEGECDVDESSSADPGVTTVEIICLDDILSGTVCTATLGAYWNDLIAHGLMYGSAYCGSARNYCVNAIVYGCYATITAPATYGGCDLTAITLIPPSVPITVNCDVTFASVT